MNNLPLHTKERFAHLINILSRPVVYWGIDEQSGNKHSKIKRALTKLWSETLNSRLSLSCTTFLPWIYWCTDIWLCISSFIIVTENVSNLLINGFYPSQYYSTLASRMTRFFFPIKNYPDDMDFEKMLEVWMFQANPLCFSPK